MTFDNLQMTRPSELPTEAEAVTRLEECIQTLTATFETLSADEMTALKSMTGVLWAQKLNTTLSENIAQQKELSYNVKEATAYILVLQLLFYHIVQRKSTLELPALQPLTEDTLSVISDTYFDALQQHTTHAHLIFRFNLFEILPNTPTIRTGINQVLTTIQNGQFEYIQHDLLGRIFHSMIPLEIRKKLAAFYSSNASARLMAYLTLRSGHARVCDLACGSGTLLVEAYHVKKHYLAANSSLHENDLHQTLLSEIYGNDVVAFASILAMINLALQNVCIIPDIQITNGNGLQLRPTGKIYSLDHWLQPAAAQQSSESETQFPMMDAVLMNPPFSRHELMDEEMKNDCIMLLKQEGNEAFLHQKFGLHCYFLLHADQFLKKGGRMGFILPTSTFTRQYAYQIIQFLRAKKYHVPYICQLKTDNLAFSEDCGFKEYIVVFEKGTLTPQSTTHLISILQPFTIDDVATLYNHITTATTTDAIEIQTILTATLYQTDKWTKLFIQLNNFFFHHSEMLAYYRHKTDAVNEYEQQMGKKAIWQNDFTEGFRTWHEKKHGPLTDLCPFLSEENFIRIQSGFQGTYSDVLFFPNHDWTITPASETEMCLRSKTSEKTCRIPKKYLRKAFRRTKYTNAMRIIPQHYILSLPQNLATDERLDAFSQTYIPEGTRYLQKKWEAAQKNGHKRIPIITEYHPNKTHPWWHHSRATGCDDRLAQLFFPSKFAALARVSLLPYSEERVTANNIFHLINTCNDRFYASYCNSAVFLAYVFREQQIIGKHYCKMEIDDFNHVKFPIYSAFTEQQKHNVIAAWETLSHVANLPSIIEQLGYDVNTGDSFAPLPERVALDTLWLQILGVPVASVEDELTELYQWLYEYTRDN